MELKYFDMISPQPIQLTIGNVVKPKLKDIARMGYDTFNFYTALMKSDPVEVLRKQHSDTYSKMTEEEINNFSMLQLIEKDYNLQIIFTEIMNFFFMEKVVYKDGIFVVISNNGEKEEIKAIVSESNFDEIIDLFLQVCGSKKQEKEETKIKFKNELAEKIFNKIQTNTKQEKQDSKLTIPNIISAVANRHPSLNILTVWELTLLQLFDSFARIQYNTLFDIDSVRVSVWGDEDNKFKSDLWYKSLKEESEID